MESNTFSATTSSSMSPLAFRSHLSQRSRLSSVPHHLAHDGSTVTQGRITNARNVATINDNRRWNDHIKYRPLSKRGIAPILSISVWGFSSLSIIVMYFVYLSSMLLNMP